MNRTLLFALTASTAVAGTTYLYGQGTPVQLQPTTPGTQQVGNANVSGRIIAGTIQAENSAPTAQVIVGNATSETGANLGASSARIACWGAPCTVVRARPVERLMVSGANPTAPADGG